MRMTWEQMIEMIDDSWDVFGLRVIPEGYEVEAGDELQPSFDTFSLQILP